jgi:hypothetical protein
MGGRTRKLSTSLQAIGSFALGIGAASVLHAQSTAPYYEVAEINVKDQAGYGVGPRRDQSPWRQNHRRRVQ